MLSVLRFDYYDQKLFDKAIFIRTTVFVKELNIDPLLECDTFDKSAHHYLIMENDLPLAAARWRETKNGVKLERFAVLKEHRGKGLGEYLLKEVLKDVKPLSRLIYLHSQQKAVKLYLKNGFEIIGDSFSEAGIEHFYMEYKG